GCGDGAESAARATGRTKSESAGLHLAVPDNHDTPATREKRCTAHASGTDHSWAGIDMGGCGLSTIGHSGRSKKWSAGAHGGIGAGTGESKMRKIGHGFASIFTDCFFS